MKTSVAMMASELANWRANDASGMLANDGEWNVGE